MDITTTQGMKQALTDKLRLGFGVTPEEADDAQVMRAAALVLRDVMTERGVESRMATRREEKRKVHYLSMEFLLGRSLEKNAYNLGVSGVLREAIGELGFRAADIFEVEPDAGLGNGGLGRLAACYLDSMTTLDIPAAGYSICYELGIFRQRIVDGQQVELPDNWKDIGGAWLMPKPQETEEVLFGGTVRKFWDNGRLHVVPEGATKVLAVPCDMEITGYGTEHVNPLRLWDAKSPTPVDMSLFSQGEYLRASEQEAMAETIAKILYPEDRHYEGKSLRLKQQYFFVSASIQRALARFKKHHSDLKDLPNKAVFQMNDTHPTVAVAELMRILVDEEHLSWDDAWDITTRCVAYTNHTIMAEALEKWPIEIFQRLLPRVYQIVDEINRRFVMQINERYPGNEDKVRKMAILYDGQVKMANMAIVAGYSVNGVAKLHTEILKNQELHDFYEMFPEKFNNKTNGITQRRFLAHANPLLADWATKKVGAGWITDLTMLSKLKAYADSPVAQQEFAEIKRANKVRLAKYIKEHNGIDVNPDSIFDVQVKRLHEYKRQQLNVLYIIRKYFEIKAGKKPSTPITCFFGAKAAPAYIIAKDIIHAILCLQQIINNDPEVSPYLKVFMVENYNVTLAEKLFPAANISEQISLASKEASGTGNMKFMLNGAITLGTSDGANVEIAELVGDENIYVFGEDSQTVIDRYERGDYCSKDYYDKDADLKKAVDFLVSDEMMKVGSKENLERLYNELLNKDWFMTFPDFEDYCKTKEKAYADYEDKKAWAKKMLVNISKAGFFSSDRTIKQYNDEIWHLEA